MTAPFSNGTDWEIFQGNWCQHCKHDHDWSHNNEPEFPDGVESCDVIIRALLDEPTPEFINHENGTECTRFERCDCEYGKDEEC